MPQQNVRTDFLSSSSVQRQRDVPQKQTPPGSPRVSARKAISSLDSRAKPLVNYARGSETEPLLGGSGGSSLRRSSSNDNLRSGGGGSSNGSPSLPPPVSAAAFEGGRSLWYAFYVIFVLLVIYVTNQFDRQVLAYIKEPVARYFSMTNGQYGLLYGYGFSIMYVLAGIPAGVLSDRYSRKLLLLCGLIMWSSMTAISGVTEAYYQFLFTRIGMGLGMAACNPAAFALIADYFPPEYRAIANSVYNFGIYFGSFSASAIGTGIARELGWQKTMVGAGVTGLGIALLFMLTVQEPPRGRYSRTRARSAVLLPPKYSLRETAQYICTLDTAWVISVSAGFRALAGYAFQAFVPNFLFAKYDPYPDHPRAKMGTYYGLIVLFGGATGSLLGGVLTRYWSRTNYKAPAYVSVIGTILSCPFVLGFLYADQLIGDVGEGSYSMALLAVFCAYVTAEVWGGPMASVYQSILPPGMQASGFAWYFVIMTGIGGAGPEIVGTFHTNGADAAAPGVLAGVIVTSYLLSALGFFITSFFIARDQDRKGIFEASKEIPLLSRRRRIIYIVGCTTLLSGAIALLIISCVRLNHMHVPVASITPTAIPEPHFNPAPAAATPAP